MTSARIILAALCLSVSVASADAQDDRLAFERSEVELARTIETKLKEIEQRSTFLQRVEDAKSSFLAAQREWLRFRDAECNARAAVAILISARTYEGLRFACLSSLTAQRIRDIGHY